MNDIFGDQLRLLITESIRDAMPPWVFRNASCCCVNLGHDAPGQGTVTDGEAGTNLVGLLTKTQLAEFLQVSTRTIDRWEEASSSGQRIGPPSMRLPGGSSRRYLMEDVRDWILASVAVQSH